MTKDWVYRMATCDHKDGKYYLDGLLTTSQRVHAEMSDCEIGYREHVTQDKKNETNIYYRITKKQLEKFNEVEVPKVDGYSKEA